MPTLRKTQPQFGNNGTPAILQGTMWVEPDWRGEALRPLTAKEEKQAKDFAPIFAYLLQQYGILDHKKSEELRTGFIPGTLA
jgi:hypothetical protein